MAALFPTFGPSHGDVPPWPDPQRDQIEPWKCEIIAAPQKGCSFATRVGFGGGRARGGGPASPREHRQTFPRIFPWLRLPIHAPFRRHSSVIRPERRNKSETYSGPKRCGQ